MAREVIGWSSGMAGESRRAGTSCDGCFDCFATGHAETGEATPGYAEKVPAMGQADT